MKKRNNPNEILIPHDGSYYAVKGKMEPAEFVALLQEEEGVIVDALKVKQAYVKAVPDEECGSVLCNVKEGTRGAFWMTSCEACDTKQVESETAA